MNKLKIYNNFLFCFFSRNGGVSKNNFSSLNCALNKGDLNKNVFKNRKIASNFFDKKKIILPNQTHSNIVLNVKKNNNKIYDADALVSKRDDLLLGILTADCAPIIVLGLEMFGIIHAGWRGVLNGIIENTIEKFISNGEKENSIKIYIGPHLKKTSFEVKDDFIQDLRKNVYNFEDYISLEEKKIKFDFSRLIKSKILNLNIKKLSISNLDTFSNPSRFFSHRYCSSNKIKNCGRQISLVGIKNN